MKIYSFRLFRTKKANPCLHIYLPSLHLYPYYIIAIFVLYTVMFPLSFSSFRYGRMILNLLNYSLYSFQCASLMIDHNFLLHLSNRFHIPILTTETTENMKPQITLINTDVNSYPKIELVPML